MVFYKQWTYKLKWLTVHGMQKQNLLRLIIMAAYKPNVKSLKTYPSHLVYKANVCLVSNLSEHRECCGLIQGCHIVHYFCELSRIWIYNTLTSWPSRFPLKTFLTLLKMFINIIVWVGCRFLHSTVSYIFIISIYLDILDGELRVCNWWLASLISI